MNELVKQTVDDDGDPVPLSEQRWCLMSNSCGDNEMLCTGNYVEWSTKSCDEATYKFKVVKRGGITCEKCKDIISYFKSIKL